MNERRVAQRGPGFGRARAAAVRVALGAVLLAALALPVLGGRPAQPAAAVALPPGFTVSDAFAGLTLPTSLRFAPDGRVFVAEKDGIIRQFDGLGDTTASVFADLRRQVYSYVDRGLLAIEVDPQWPTRPYLYALYSYDHMLGDPAPAPMWNDTCPGTGNPVDNGACRASARLVRLTADPLDLGRVVPGSERVLVEDWCQQYPVHINGDVRFGSDGALYASHGEAGSAHYADYGQGGQPANGCGDPPVPVGGVQAPPTAEGGSLRAQDPLTPNDPYTLDGTIIRVDPDTGAGLPGNPLYASTDANARRIVVHGLRMPFRFAPRPGANELWVGDVGANLHEEIDRVTIGGALLNAGWPCYEANHASAAFAPFNLCRRLATAGPGAVLPPALSYRHDQPMFPGDPCPVGSSSVAGIAFYPGGAYPDRYDGAMFVADYARRCIYAVLPGADGLPDPARVELLVRDQRGMTDIQIGPGGDLYANDIIAGKIIRFGYSAGNRPPTASVVADRTSGPLPLAVRFDARASVDPDGDALGYEWDLDADGAFDDSTAVAPARTYAAAGSIPVRVRVTDAGGASAVASIVITAGNSAPALVIDAPRSGRRWAVGDEIAFSATATDPEQGVLPTSAYTWRLTLQHCPAACHAHPSGVWEGTRSGSFAASGHEYPSYLELTVTARDAGGLETSRTVTLFPQVAHIAFVSDPPGLVLDAEGTAGAPFTRPVIRGNRVSVTAADQTIGYLPFAFDGWSDGGAASHDVVADADRTLTAAFSPRLLRIPDRVVFERASATTPSIPVLLNRAAQRDAQVRWETATDTAGPDDIGLGPGILWGRVTVIGGTTARSLPTSLLADTIDEPIETFRVRLSRPVNALIADDEAQVQIVDDDGPPAWTYVAALSGDAAALMERAAARLGVDRNELPRLGAQFLAFLAALDPANVPSLAAPAPGEWQYATSYASLADRDAMLRAASAYGLGGADLHTVGAQVVAFLVLLG